MTSQPLKPHKGIVKQVLSGDSVIIRGLSGAPPPEKQINFTGVTAPKLARRPGETGESTKDEPWAWEAREFLRKKLVGEEVLFTFEKPPNVNREYGTVYLGKDPASAENITESLISEGLVTVRREGIKQSPELTRFIELEDAAKAAGKGKWGSSPTSDHVRDIKWSVDNLRTLVEKYKNKPVKAIIEHVVNGSTVRAFLLPDFYYITLMMSGIRCPNNKLDASGKEDPNEKSPYAEEARYYVSVRILQRDVEIILESSNNNNIIGTIVHPKANIAESLLREGFAHCVDWSMKSNAERLRAAERQAKDARKRIWKDVNIAAPKPTGKEYTATVTEVINGDALMLKLPNGTNRKVFLASIRPPREAGRVADEEGKQIARPKNFRPLYDIPWMFEAREYLRKKLIGKKVQVIEDYKQPARDNFPEKVCATVTVNGKNVAEALVSKGLAYVVRYKVTDDQRSSRYDELLTAEDKASKSQLGVHSKKEGATLRVTEIDAGRAKLELSTFQRANRVDAIVEFVSSGSRFRLFIPKSSALCTFLLAGINCPRASRPATATMPASDGEPYGDEAMQFMREKCLQREVSIQVESVAKPGNFVGWMWVDNVNMSVALVEQGFASVYGVGDKGQYHQALRKAEEEAKKKRLRIWKDYVEEEKVVEQNEDDKVVNDDIKQQSFEEVFVTEITSEGTYFVQKLADGPKAENFFAKFRQEFEANPPLPGAYTPKKGDVCAAKFTADDEWYRVKVEKVQGGNASVHYIDYGNRETLPTNRLASLPAAYSSERPFAQEFSMPYVTLPKDEEFRTLTLRYMREDTAGKLKMAVVYKNQGTPPAAALYTADDANHDIVKNLVSEGLLIVNDIKTRRKNNLLESYRNAQEAAKKNHLHIWEYGDITEVDAKEFGLGN